MLNAARLLTIAASPLMLLACAPSGPSPSDQASARPERRCFQADQVNNFRVDRQTLYVKAGHSAVYELTTSGACLDLDTSTRVGLGATGGASSLCVGDMANVITPGSAVGGACRARIERQLAADQVAALPARLRP